MQCTATIDRDDTLQRTAGYIVDDNAVNRLATKDMDNHRPTYFYYSKTLPKPLSRTFFSLTLKFFDDRMRILFKINGFVCCLQNIKESGINFCSPLAVNLGH